MANETMRIFFPLKIVSGLAEYIHDEALKEMVYCLYPSVETIDACYMQYEQCMV